MMWTILWKPVALVLFIIYALFQLFRVNEATKQFLNRYKSNLLDYAADFIVAEHHEEFRVYFKNRVLGDIRNMKHFNGGIER